MKTYRDATNYLCDIFEERVKEGGLLFRESTFISMSLSITNLVEMDWTEVEEEWRLNQFRKRRFAYYRIDLITSQFLSQLAEQDEFAFDYCMDICSTNTLAGAPLPIHLRSLISRVLSGDTVRPTKKSRPVRKNWMEQFLLYLSAIQMAEMFGLSLTRNDEGSNRASACDAVAEALSVCGKPTKYSDIKYLMVHPDKALFRNQANVYRKMYQRWEQNIAKLESSEEDDSDDTRALALHDVLDIYGTYFPDDEKTLPNT